MRPKNLTAEIFIFIFTVVSFYMYVQSIFKDSTTITYLALLVYIIPQLIDIINEFASEYLNRVMVIIDIVIMAVAICLVIASFIFMLESVTPNSFLKYVMTSFSIVFVIRSVVNLLIEIIKHYNVHKSMKKDLEA